MIVFKRNIFGHVLFIKKWLIRIIGFISYKRFQGINQLNITGINIIKDLPENNVLFISNHQTYFADATAMFHVFNASINSYNDIRNKKYIWNPKLNIYFIAAKETMKSGILPRILAYAGSVPIERTWKNKDTKIKRNVQYKDVNNINKAIKDGWLITFPQGTTEPWAPIRKGTAHIIKENKPIVIPIVIDGFRESFDKTGLRIRKKGVMQSMIIKKPLEIDYTNDTLDDIVDKVSFAIEQHSSLK